ncbi:MAG: glycosyltransferase family 39 protein, partial [Candidatus Binatia bacterium]
MPAPVRSAPPRAAVSSAVLARLATIAGPVVIGTTGIAVLAWTWRRWPDPVVDFGREAYTAWQLAGGKTLYVDVAHFSGPLSAYVNALWMWLFGPGILTLALCNVALTAAFVAMLYSLLVRVATRLAATAACVVFVAIFSCGQYVRIANYNWICPYSHELPHGVVLATAALWCLDRYHRSGRMRWMGGVGLAAGLLVLTKAEIMLAGAPALAVGLGLTLAAERPPARRAAALLATFVGAAALPLVVTFVGFARVMPVADVLAWPLGHWRAAARPDFMTSSYYREGMGVDDVAGSLGKLATAALWPGLVLGAAVAGAFALRNVRAGRSLVAAVTFVATAVLVNELVPIDAWAAALRLLPVVAALVAASSLAGFLRQRGEPERAYPFAVRTALAVFAFGLLAKMILNARVYHYGFVLAAPATVVLVVAVVEWLPAAVERRGGYGGVVRAVALGALAAAIPTHLAFEETLLARKGVP